MHTSVPWLITAAAPALILGSGIAVRLAMTADPALRTRAREAAAAVAQYSLLFGFAAVAAVISARGLVGFARNNMGLPGLWPYLLWGALDGAAGLCAVLLMRRAARGESALAPRLAVWGLVAASSLFNWAHAPDHPGAREAFALMPVIAATLFEFSLRETRHIARGARYRPAGPGWLRPVEQIRVRLQLSADENLTVEAAATRRVRAECAARRLHLLRQALTVRERAANSKTAARRMRRAERRAQAALARARFTDPAVAAEVLRLVQVLTLTQTLARLDYATPGHAQQVLASLITPPTAGAPAVGSPASPAAPPPLSGPVASGLRPNGYTVPSHLSGIPARTGRIGADGLAHRTSPGNGHPRPDPRRGLREQESRDGPLIEVATSIVARARLRGDGLSQAALARQHRAEGYRIANDRLRWLATVSGLDAETGRT
jgi:Protein of unknown function (DUF2637)